MGEAGKRLLLSILEVLFGNFEIVVRADGSELVIRFRQVPMPTHLKILDENHEEIPPMDTIAFGKKRVLTFGEADRKNNPLSIGDFPIVGKPVWTCVPDGAIQLSESTDAMECEAANINGVAVDDFVVTVEADVTTPFGTKHLSGSVHLSALAEVIVPDHLVPAVGPEVDL